MSGDGGFSMLMGDLITLTQMKLPVKVVIFNNSVLGFVALEMKAAGFIEFQTARNISVEGVVGACLVGEKVRYPPAPHHIGQDIGAVADEPDRQRRVLVTGSRCKIPRLFKVSCFSVEISGVDPPLYTCGIHFNRKDSGSIHRSGQRLRSAHAAKSAGQQDLSPERTLEMLSPGGRECFVRSLNDALRSDVDPAAGGHLPIHRELQRFQTVELIARRPMRDEIGIGNQDSR